MLHESGWKLRQQHAVKVLPRIVGLGLCSCRLNKLLGDSDPNIG
jgi:hypothetical protein